MKKKRLSLLISIAVIVFAIQLSLVATIVPSIFSENNSQNTVEVSDSSDVDDSDEDSDVVTDNTNIDPEYEDYVSYGNPDEDEEQEKLVESVVSGEFDGHTVTVSGLMPEGTTIKLSDVDGNSVDKLMNEMGQDNSVFACDIKLIDVDGNEWQPSKNGVDVSISGFEIEDENKLEFYHIAEDIDTVLNSGVTGDYVGAIDQVSLTKDGEASFETYGFSTYIGFTVDFHYNGASFSIAGMSDVLLSEIFTQLQIQRDATKVTSLKFSDDSLISVERQANGDWLLTSLAPFNTEEKLTIVFSGEGYEETIEMLVTDATYTKATYTFDGIEEGGTVQPASGNTVTFNVTGSVYLKAPIVVPKGVRLIIQSDDSAGSHNFWKYTNFKDSMIKVESGGALKIDGSASHSDYPLSFYGKKKQDGNEDATALTIEYPLILFKNGTNEYGGGTYKFGYFIMNKVNVKDVKSSGSFGGAIQINGKLNEVRVTNCNFSNITSTDVGSAIKTALDTNLVKTMNTASDTAKPGQFYLSKNKFTNCVSTGLAGGAVSINGTVAGAVTINECDFTKCKAKQGGAIRFIGETKAETTISSCTFDSCEATNPEPGLRLGGAVYVNNTTDTTHNGFLIKTSGFKDCKSHRGGAIYLAGDTVVNNNFEVSGGCTFTNCNAVCDATCANTHAADSKTVYESTDGGAICLQTGSKVKGSFILGKINFLNCRADNSGGAVFVNSTIKNFVVSPVDNTSLTSFENCTAAKHGGGICFNNNSDITNVYINKHADGGTGNNKVTNDDTADYKNTSNSRVKFINCKADKGGGALRFGCKVGTCEIRKILIEGCESTNGSALYIESNDAKINKVIFKDSVVRNCNSKQAVEGDNNYGGTIRTTGPVSCNLELTNCRIYNNNSWHSGGGVYWNAAGTGITNPSKIIINECIFDSNDACRMGGGIYCESDMEIMNTVVKGNTSGNNGGGIAQTVYNNIGTNWKATETNLTLGTGVKIHNNTAALNGGGIALIMRTSKNVYASDLSNKKFTLSFTMDDVVTDALVYDNTAGQYGGGVYYGTGNTTGTNDGVYSENPLPESQLPSYTHEELKNRELTAEESQGLVDLYKKKINIKAGSIYNNISGKDGGGIYAKGKSVTINVSNGMIYSNSAGVTDKTITKLSHNKNTTTGITTSLDTVNVNLSAATEGQGGGICIKGDSAECIFNGGYVGEYLNGSTVVSAPNKSDSGGGVAAKSATIYIDGHDNNTPDNTLDDTKYSTTSYIRNNIAHKGAGMYVTNGGAIVMYGGEVTSNKATSTSTENTKNGGGAYVTGEGSKVTLYSGNIKNNIADSNGGGIYCVENATAKMTGGNIQNNVATYKGGGVYLDSATLDMSSGNISSNAVTKADDSFGGGVYIANKSNLVLTNGNITNNTAQYIGGGLYSDNSTAEIGGNISNNGSLSVNGSTINTTYGGGAFVVNHSTLDLTGSIDNNKASHSGGGIGLDSATLIMTNGNITKNTAVYGGGIFASKQSEISVTGTNSDTSGNISYNTAQKGGGIFVKNCYVNLSKASLDHNQATNGPGGAIYAIEGGSVKVSEGFIRYNEALGENGSSTAYDTTDFTGIGGGVCIADGASDTNRTTFTLSGGNIGIYENTASFAADDVYASGKFTDLNVPNKDDMNLTGYDGKASGWYEDYPNQDTSYDDGIGMDSQNVGSRYRNTIQQHSRKYIFENVNAPAEGKDKFVNKEDTYVAMTLGISTTGELTVSKSIIDENGVNCDGKDDTEFTFRIYRYENGQTSSLTADEITAINYTLSGSVIQALDPNGDFTLKGGQNANFTGLNGTYVIAEILDGKEYRNYVVSTSYKVTNGINSSGTGNTTCSFDVTNGQAVYVDFENILNSVDITFKFYDRNLTEDGVPADIDKIATEYTKSFIGKDYYEYFVMGGKTFSSMLSNIGADVGSRYNNVVDEYYFWSSQAKSVEGIAKMSVPNRTYGNSVIYHTDRYGRAFGDEGYEIADTDNEKWITYYNNGTEVDFENNACAANDVTSINVWLYNTPKQYDVNINHAQTGDDLDVGPNGVFVANKSMCDENGNSTYKAYYNQRLGTSYDDTLDKVTNHLYAYGILGYLGKSINTAYMIDDEEFGALKFSYWSFDPNGETVASTQINYNNRITNDLNLYAIYEKSPSKAPGVTISWNETDKIIGSDGVEKTRLNTMLNPYNCYNMDDNIKKVSVIYVVSATGEVVDVAQFQDIIVENLKANAGKNSFTVKDDDTNQVYYVYVDPVLSNKNRVQFTGSFKTNSLKNRNIAVFAAMYYNGVGVDNETYDEWIVSDNSVNYEFDSNGACVSTSFNS